MEQREFPPQSPEKYRAFLETLGTELDREHPGVFAWRFGKPSPSIADGLIITKEDVEGYVFVVGSCRWPGSMQGGVWREGAEHSYTASALAQREWELEGVSHWNVQHLESRCSSDSADIIDWLMRDWAYERPWHAAPPTDQKAEKKRLAKIADGLRSRADLPVIVEAAPGAAHKLTPSADAALRHDVAGVLADPIRRSFPNDKRGGLALKSTVLLARYETTSPPAPNRCLCLVAAGPARRADPQEIRVRLEVLIPPNQEYSWEHDRWRWHADSAAIEPAAAWGAPVPVDALAAGTLSARELEESVRQGRGTEDDRAALALLLQEEGRLLDALDLYEVEVDEDLRRLCGGQKIYPPACCAHADETWVERFHEWLRACAPWLLGKTTRREAERIAAWAAEKKGRRRRPPLLKLFIFPGQHHSRKASLMLTSIDLEGTKPRLVMQATASNVRLHESGWRRPLELDLARYQLDGL